MNYLSFSLRLSAIFFALICIAMAMAPTAMATPTAAHATFINGANMAQTSIDMTHQTLQEAAKALALLMLGVNVLAGLIVHLLVLPFLDLVRQVAEGRARRACESARPSAAMWGGPGGNHGDNDK